MHLQLKKIDSIKRENIKCFNAEKERLPVFMQKWGFIEITSVQTHCLIKVSTWILKIPN